ncbi:hypothetical protein SAMN02910413_0320 [Pseudobutyrivibrio sp. C4]|uniref:hypothetical protein n=1 Tax=Pseudobutyrivibrio sp. C4 TaxID=1520803 RepID=UPI0008B25B02|nr:hypothetical protein [Pseudobutyrivibrio sp. C4]SES65749.1 hypothetical protein SAMN02910413_0320 [Pseudobutyrivibrio sp. C4]
MGLLDRPIRGGSDRMFDFNRDGVLDPNELDAQECFLHDVDTFDEIFDEDEDWDEEDEDNDDWDDDEDDDEDEDWDEEDDDDYDDEVEDSSAFINQVVGTGIVQYGRYAVDESKLEKEYYPDRYYINREKKIIPKPMNWHFFYDHYTHLDENTYPKYAREMVRFEHPDEIIEFAEISWYKEAGKIILERSSVSGIIFTLKQIASLAGIYDDELILALTKKTLAHGGDLHFKDFEYFYGEVDEKFIDKIAIEWINLNLPITKEDLYSFEGESSEAVFCKVSKYALDNHLDFGVDELMEFMSYYSESLASEFAEGLLKRGYVFSTDEMFALDGYVTEKTLSKSLKSYLESGKTLTISEIYDFDGSVSKAVLSEAVRTCKEIFTLSDFNELEDSVSRAALLDVAKRQGGLIKYDEYEGFYLKD